MNKLQRIELRAFKAGMRHAARLGRVRVGEPQRFTPDEVTGVDALKQAIVRAELELRAMPGRRR